MNATGTATPPARPRIVTTDATDAAIMNGIIRAALRTVPPPAPPTDADRATAAAILSLTIAIESSMA
jgi:hypothetical protein